MCNFHQCKPMNSAEPVSIISPVAKLRLSDHDRQKLEACGEAFTVIKHGPQSKVGFVSAYFLLAIALTMRGRAIAQENEANEPIIQKTKPEQKKTSVLNTLMKALNFLKAMWTAITLLRWFLRLLGSILEEWL